MKDVVKNTTPTQKATNLIGSVDGYKFGCTIEKAMKAAPTNIPHRILVVFFILILEIGFVKR